MAKPAFETENKLEWYGRDSPHRYEEGLHLMGSDVRDIGYGLVFPHGCYVFSMLVDCPEQQHAKKHAQPYGATKHW